MSAAWQAVVTHHCNANNGPANWKQTATVERLQQQANGQNPHLIHTSITSRLSSSYICLLLPSSLCLPAQTVCLFPINWSCIIGAHFLYAVGGMRREKYFSGCTHIWTLNKNFNWKTSISVHYSTLQLVIVISTRNSSGDEIANVNFLYDDIVHALKIQ